MHQDKRKEIVQTTLQVHRCRFVDYAPSAITALAFPPLPLPPAKRKKGKAPSKRILRYGTLAVGHANGNIDLCEWAGSEQTVQCSQAWVVRKTMPGPYPSKVDSLAFVIRYPDELGFDDVPSLSDLRLFSSGGGSELLEWCLERSCVKRTISSQGGAIWCVVANPASNYLALGCEDGTVRLLTIANDGLTHYRRFDRVKCRILSIAWGPPQPRQAQSNQQHTAGSDMSSDSEEDDDSDEDEWKDSWLVTGCSDSSVRKWDVQTGRALERMAVGKVRGERTLVWTVGVLGDGTIISGDSLGHVKFWDSRTCTQLHSFQAHGADVLSLSINPEGKAVYTAGVDQKVVQFSLIKTTSSTSSSARIRWAQTASRRLHSHDIRAIASWPPYTVLPPGYQRTFPLDIAPILASGGLDMSMVLTPAALPESTTVKVVNPLATSTEATFGDAYHRKLAYTVGNGVHVSRNKRLMLCLREAGVSIWRILKFLQEENGVEEEETEPWTGGWEKVLEMDLNVTSNLVTGELSEDGRWLAISDMYETKLFLLRADNNDQLSVKRIRDFPALIHASIPNASSTTSLGALVLRFTPDSSKLVLSTAQSSYILIIDLTDEKPRLLRRFEHHRLKESVVGDRVVKSLKRRQNKELNGVSINGAAAHEDADMEMENADEADTDEENISQDSQSVVPGDSSSEEDNNSPLAEVLPSVLRMAISPDGQWLATSDDQRHTHIFNLDSISHHGLLPSFPLPAESLIFSPSNPNILFLAFPDNSLQVYDVESRQFPYWSKDLSLSSSSSISPIAKRLAGLHDPILGICFPPLPTTVPVPDEDSVMDTVKQGGDVHTDKSPYALLWGANWLLKFPLSLTSTIDGSKSSKKRRRAQQELLNSHSDVAPGEESLVSRSSKLITHYRPILHVEFLSHEELVVVERPLVDVLSMLPPAYFKHKYGSS